MIIIISNIHNAIMIDMFYNSLVQYSFGLEFYISIEALPDQTELKKALKSINDCFLWKQRKELNFCLFYNKLN